MKSLVELIDPEKMYDVTYTIKQDGTKVFENTKLLGKDLTENQIKEIAVGMPSEFQKYILKSLDNIKHEGEIKSIHSYGASSFIKFKNGKCYRLNFQLYNDEVCLD